MKHLLNLALISVFILCIYVPQALAQTVENDVQKAEDYLRNLGTVKAKFIQTDNNGSRLSGTFYLNRPGKLRFEYNEIDDFIVADGFFIYFYDSELGEQTNAPIGQTLADFLLREDLALQEDVSVQNVSRDENHLIMSLAEKGDEGAGSIKLFFNEEPYQLEKWQIVDAAGLTTEIMLQNMERDLDLPARLFAYFTPKQDSDNYNE